MKAPHSRRMIDALTQREMEVLQGICDCKTDAEIGSVLKISTHTVSKHAQRIYKKLGVDNRMAAARSAGPEIGKRK